MAAVANTIRLGNNEAAILSVPGFTPVTPATAAFARFLGGLPALIEAERDLGDYTGHDPAVDAWIRAAEAARDETLLQIAAVLETQEAHPGDAALRTVARLYRRVLLSASAEEVALLRRQAARRQEVVLLPATSINALRVNRMIRTALTRLETYLSLDDRLAEDPEATLDCTADCTADCVELPAA